MKKILVIVPFAFHRASGSSLSTYYRILSLLKLGHQVDVICYPHGEDLNLDNLTIIRAPRKRVFKFIQPGEYQKKIVYDCFLFMKTLIRLLTKKYDIVIPHGTMYYWAFFLIPFYFRKLIPTVHGKIEVDLKKWEISGNKRIYRIAEKIESYILRKYKLIICEHQSVYDALVKDIPDKKLCLIKMASISISISKTPKSNDKFVILYTGTFVKVQNLELLIETANLLKDDNSVIFKLVGGIKEEIIELNSIITAKSLNNIILIERVSYKEVEEYLIESNVVVSPRCYGFDTPMKIIDYLNFGKCIIASKMPIHFEILNDMNSFLVEPTPEDFADCIGMLRNHPEKIIEKELIAKEYFEQNFRLEKMIEDYKRCFKGIDSLC